MIPAPRSRHESRATGLLFGLLGVVVPRVFDWTLRLIRGTSRVRVLHPEHDLDRRGEPVLFVTLHQGLLYFIHHFRDRDGVVMASRSRDGDLIAAVLARLGYRAARGSDSKGGVEALDEMIELMRDSRLSGGLTCDGPRGPYGAVKLGIVKLAQETGRPIVPCALWMTRKKLLSNWDRTIVPLPFSRIVLSFGAPVYVPADTEWEELKAIRDEIVQQIAGLIREAREAAGEPVAS